MRLKITIGLAMFLFLQSIALAEIGMIDALLRKNTAHTYKTFAYGEITNLNNQRNTVLMEKFNIEGALIACNMPAEEKDEAQFNVNQAAIELNSALANKNLANQDAEAGDEDYEPGLIQFNMFQNWGLAYVLFGKAIDHYEDSFVDSDNGLQNIIASEYFLGVATFILMENGC